MEGATAGGSEEEVKAAAMAVVEMAAVMVVVAMVEVGLVVVTVVAGSGAVH